MHRGPKVKVLSLAHINSYLPIDFKYVGRCAPQTVQAV